MTRKIAHCACKSSQNAKKISQGIADPSFFVHVGQVSSCRCIVFLQPRVCTIPRETLNPRLRAPCPSDRDIHSRQPPGSPAAGCLQGPIHLHPTHLHPRRLAIHIWRVYRAGKRLASDIRARIRPLPRHHAEAPGMSQKNDSRLDCIR
jgi:hypothetical protein